MKTTLVVYTNSDDALLLWTADAVEDGCRGFAVERKLRRGQGAVTRSWLDNYAPPPRTSTAPGRHQSSVEWPFRRFTWTDHSVGAGDRVSYRVVPVFDVPDTKRGSRWSPFKTLGVPASARYAAFFNRGFVISQFMSRYLDEHYSGLTRSQALRRFKADAANVEDRLRRFLSGQLRTELLELLESTRQGNGHVYAALFELGDGELVEALAALGPRAHVVLANGAIETKKDPRTGKAIETSAEARKRDENKAARRALLASGVDVDKAHRFVSPGALAHNKFLVVTDAAGTPRRAWTGSTNWTTTGLCTQLNNGLLVNDSGVAAAYFTQWQALRAAGSLHPSTLASGNDTPADVGTGRTRASVHFTRAQRRVDLDALGAIVRGAKEGVFFLMFIPGAKGVLADIRAVQAAKPDLLVRGVVSQLPKGRQDEKTGTTTTVRVTLVGGPNARLDGASTFDVVQPQGKTHPAAYWAAEVTRAQFLGNIGHAIIHSKVLLVDPLSDEPVVVTGSHNFSGAASGKNDENFVIIRGDKKLAESYLVNVQGAWRHYAARLGNPHPNLGGVDYLRALLNDQRQRDAFWRLA
jgi:phosphatidylserine/phosphatidylglycerophosphate/cardiolipin synthase-like enzyme